ncbi:D-aspartate oxidase-like isoform X1 [Microcaecilia unicolor]|uniref:D-aspartate oxidase n=2 Tax=Microcaecilia unicolor TaxID=1415580 RepID=A0A6P7XHT9_9AMPH|nr:D-aspartate oxidase-like isoform X1 [Microcaecilia unicolor]
MEQRHNKGLVSVPLGLMPMRRVAVIGGGLVGFSTAVCISKSLPRCSVTVIADKFTPNTTGDVAAGMLIPHRYPDTPIEQQKRWFQETFSYLLTICNSAEAADAGIHLLSGWQIHQTAPEEKFPFWADIVLGFRIMSMAELEKFPEHQFGQAFTTLKCDSQRYLRWLESRLRENGGQIEDRKITDVWELHGHYDVIVNCSGLGARALVGDSKLHPVRGQVLKVQAPWVTHFIRVSDGSTYIYPGMSSVTLGGTRQKDDWRLSTDATASQNILNRCCALEPSLKKAYAITEHVGLRPTRSAIRVEKEVLLRGSYQLPVIHNYGHGGGGFSVHWGTAREATHLVEELIASLRGSSAKAKL